MDGRYPGPGFAERRGSAGETADWANSSSATVSTSYGSTQTETELLHRQTYTSSNTLSTYTTSRHPVGVSGVFDTSLHNSVSSTTESSIMNFLNSVESRGLQAGPAATTLLPPLRTTLWQSGTHSSTELFLTGALPSSATFSTLAGLSSFQHPSTFPTRSFPTTSALTVQHTTFSPSNGLLPPNDPLLQIKPSHTTVQTAFAFERLGGASLGANLPIQSSTYRSAQESAPHLLQPQFSLLPSSINNSQSASQPYGAPVFSSSLERALQRECSVIKHHQRPSSTQPVQQHQLSGSAQHSLLGYLPDDNDISYEEASRHTPVPNSANGVTNGTANQKAALVPIQTLSSTVSSPGFSSLSELEAKDKLNNMVKHISEGTDLHDQEMSSHKQQPRYAQKQSSVIASHSQSYTPEQLSSLVSISPSQTYNTSQSLSNLSEPQSFFSSQPEKLPPIYKTLPLFSGGSEIMASVSQSLVYSSDQEQILSSAANKEDYDKQVQGLCMGSLPQNYSSSQSQSLPNIMYYTQGSTAESPSQSYTPSPHFSPTQPQSLPSGNSTTQDFTQMQHFPVTKTDGLLLQQPQKYLSSVQSPASSTAAYTQALKDNQSSLEQKPAYSKRKQDENEFLTSKYRREELPIQEVQALQQASIEISTQTFTNNYVGSNSNAVYVLSKMEDKHVQSVIRSNSRSEDQVTSVEQISSIKNERTSTLHENTQLISNANPAVTSSPKDSTFMQSSHVALNTDQLKEPVLPLKDSTVQQENQQHGNMFQEQTQFVRLPNAQVLLDPSQMILFQQALLSPVSSQFKPAVQIQPVSFQFLPVSNDVLNSAVSLHENQQLTLQAVETVKQPLVLKDSFSSQSHPHDSKQPFSLSSICFPESVMMADERSILSNVDDILAATAAACGVTPQDFKTSEGQLASISNPADSKYRFQLAENQQGTNSFTSQHLSANTQTLTLNGGQLTTDIDKEVDGHHLYTTANSQSQDVSNQEMSNTDHPGKNKTLQKRPLSNDSSLNSNGSSVNPTTLSHSDLQSSAAQELNSTGFMKTDMDKNQPSVIQNVKIEGNLIECPLDVLSKKKIGSKANSRRAGEDQNVQPKSQKRSGQVKRQNPKCSETSSSSDGYLDSYQQQERIRQKIKEVEEKQPEVKSGFIGSFLDFLKSGPKQHFSSPPIRSPNRTKKPSIPKKPSQPLLVPSPAVQPATPVVSPDINNVSCAKKLDEELQKNLETLPTFSSDEEESVGKNKDLQKRISSALSSLDESSEKKRPDNRKSGDGTNHVPPFSTQSVDKIIQEHSKSVQNVVLTEELVKNVPPNKLAVHMTTVAIEGHMDEGLSDSGGEGMYRIRDEFVVKNEDIESLQVTLQAGMEPPAIWKVQKALLQKFIPELRDGKRVFSATNSYLGYFGDAKTMYRRVYVKFLDTVNKREYVRVCKRKPRSKPMHSMRASHMKALLAQRATAPSDLETPSLKPSTKQSLSKPRPRQPKVKAEPPPKKRKKWKEEFTASPESTSAPEAVSEDDEFTPPVPFASRFLNTRTMKESFKSFVELLISIALDADVMINLENENDELLLPHMKKVDGMITDNRRRLLPKLRVGQVFKNALDSLPELSVVTEVQTDGEMSTFKVHLSGNTYNRKTMRPDKSLVKVPTEYMVEQQKTHWFSLYHSLQHYKYHTYLTCMEEIALLRSRGRVDFGQEETVQKCLGNGAWVEGLFDRFGELLTQVQQACL
ncbi:glutamine and serine-rich protein 1 [Trichomycterus rosablanca]|uniref:glutamine and serine-rich protein 1 n=1 Tax=Trichomycterus rosablanca TaxID=2290929 RepID=UPI002F35FB6A